MYSDGGNGCSHPLGFPIQKSQDHSLLAAPRSLSQLTTSFFAYLCLGIHTHALSSLTIKSTSHTRHTFCRPADTSRLTPRFSGRVNATFSRLLTCVVGSSPPSAGSPTCNARQIFSCQRSRLRQQSVERSSSTDCCLCLELVGLGGIEPPTSPLSGVRSSHVSYRPKGAGGAGRDRTGDLLNANQALSQLSYSP